MIVRDKPIVAARPMLLLCQIDFLRGKRSEDKNISIRARLSSILSNVLSNVLSTILSTILSNILSSILSSILSNMLSNMNTCIH